MRCARCDAENPAEMRFCGQCGAPLAFACRACGVANPATHRFCGGCGAPLAAALPGELKQVSVLFCDLVNSVPTTERLGAEAMRDLVAGFLDAALGEVRRYGGSAPQFSGDGFMALFGAPVTQEDHVRRALLAALAIRRAFAESQRNSNGRPEHELRIGVHTGPVVFGAVGGGLGIETAIGDTANLAARLQQAAEPTAILVSEQVQALAQGYARLEPVGLLTLKGKSEPVAAYRLLGVSRWRSARDAVMPARLTRFVGRDHEVSLLRDLLEQAESGRGRVVGVAGEPGIGKSRLLAECRRGIEGRRMTWVEGRCLSYGAQIPYQLILDVLRSNCGIVEADSAEDIVRKVRAGLAEAGMDAAEDGPILLHLLGVEDAAAPAAVPPAPEAVKARSFEVLRRFSIAGSRQRPLVLVLEDLHWIDAVSEEFLGDLVRHVGGSRILLLVTYRPEYRPPWAGLADAAEVRVGALSRGDSLAVLRSILPEERLADPLAAEIVARADGNPLFLEQLALHAGEAEPRSAEIAMPHTINGVVMARIDRLPPAAKGLLQMAAVIGREFSLRLLRALWRESAPLEGALRELSRLEFLDEWPDDEGTNYVFRHALTQEAAYGSLLARQRRHHHHAVGEALEALYPGRAEEVAELLAWHFGRSDEAGKAVDYAIAAAEKSQRHCAYSEALSYFDDALRRLAGMPNTRANRERRVDIVLNNEAKYALGQYTDQIADLSIIRNIVDDIGDPKRLATWYYWTGFLHSVSGGQPDIAIESCRKAASIASDSGLNEIEAFAESCLTQAYAVAGRLRDAIEVGERAVSSFEAGGDLWWATLTLWHLAGAANYMGDWNKSIDYCRRGLEHGRTLDDVRLKAVSWSRLGLGYIHQGNVEYGLECCDEALRVASIPRDAAWARVVRGYGKVKAGRTGEGITELSRALAWFETSHMRFTQVIVAVWLAEGYLRRGDFAGAQPLIDRVLAASRATGYRHYEGRACWLMSECLALKAPGTAEDFAESAMRIFERVGANNDLARAMVTRAALRQRAGDIPTARKFLYQADSIYRTLGTLDEPQRVKAALAALDCGSEISLLAGHLDTGDAFYKTPNIS